MMARRLRIMQPGLGGLLPGAVLLALGGCARPAAPPASPPAEQKAEPTRRPPPPAADSKGAKAKAPAAKARGPQARQVVLEFSLANPGPFSQAQQKTIRALFADKAAWEIEFCDQTANRQANRGWVQRVVGVSDMKAQELRLGEAEGQPQMQRVSGHLPGVAEGRAPGKPGEVALGAMLKDFAVGGQPRRRGDLLPLPSLAKRPRIVGILSTRTNKDGLSAFMPYADAVGLQPRRAPTAWDTFQRASVTVAPGKWEELARKLRAAGVKVEAFGVGSGGAWALAGKGGT